MSSYTKEFWKSLLVDNYIYKYIVIYKQTVSELFSVAIYIYICHEYSSIFVLKSLTSDRNTWTHITMEKIIRIENCYLKLKLFSSGYH